MDLRPLLVVHRWLGVALCLFFLVWFPSAIGMMYWDFPTVTAEDRLARSAAIDPAAIALSPGEAFAALRLDDAPTDVRLNTFDGRPVYRFRVGREDRVVFADSGEVRGTASLALMRRVAARWSGNRAAAAVMATVDDVDQWTVQGPVRALLPLWRFAWDDGQQVYVADRTGEVVQYTTKAARIGAYLGPIPHWLYFTPLRKRQSAWTRVVIWSSAIATLTAALGVAIGLLVAMPAKRIPYRGQKRWHAICGLIFGAGAVTWAFSGMLSMDPFPVERANAPPPFRLRDTARLADFSVRGAQEAIRALAPSAVKQLELTSAFGESVYAATLDGGTTRIVIPGGGAPRGEFDRQRIVATVRNAGGDASVLVRYDAYYRDRRRERRLPVVLARMRDADDTRYYIDPRTARIVTTYSSRNWIARWLYHGLHSLDLPWLYDHRPAWDILVIVFMLGGTTLSVTSVILAWRVLVR